ncbi:putative nuclease HARBI1 [Aethina tumida]|uniref:putative nuclease HARBI1 n=1 Tax=Aethina tumida TaxID=116153 RepID=UPI0021487CF6|nr:putative nuclease HARBI1 [Aethina tumida]
MPVTCITVRFSLLSCFGYQKLTTFQCFHCSFSEKYNFPGVIGCIDCTHVAIFSPKIDEYVFVNRKGYHSINVQLICGANLEILNVIAKYPGSSHDSFIWNNSDIQNALRNIHQAGMNGYYLLGDSGYPLRPWLMTPLEHEPAMNTPEYHYSKAHKRVRSIIERCNGLFKARFRCCRKDRVLHYAPEMSCKIINACVVLHNICIKNNLILPEDENEDDHADDGLFDNLLEIGGINPELVAGKATRNRLITARFQTN